MIRPQPTIAERYTAVGNSADGYQWAKVWDVTVTFVTEAEALEFANNPQPVQQFGGRQTERTAAK